MAKRIQIECGAGGFSSLDQRVLFYNRVRSLLRSDMTVLDFGAGRGRWSEVEHGWRRELTNLRGRCREVIGFDVDEVVLHNPDVDRAVYAEVGHPLPLADESIDLVVSWATFEHVTDPRFYASELRRILKPGGWICGWTPNRWTYFALGARVIPSALHGWVLRRLNPRAERDTFPTVYHMNTLGTIRKLFPERDFDDYSFLPLTDAAYFGESALLAWVWGAWIRFGPTSTRPYIHVFLRRKGDS